MALDIFFSLAFLCISERLASIECRCEILRRVKALRMKIQQNATTSILYTNDVKATGTLEYPLQVCLLLPDKVSSMVLYGVSCDVIASAIIQEQATTPRRCFNVYGREIRILLLDALNLSIAIITSVEYEASIEENAKNVKDLQTASPDIILISVQVNRSQRSGIWYPNIAKTVRVSATAILMIKWWRLCFLVYLRARTMMKTLFKIAHPPIKKTAKSFRVWSQLVSSNGQGKLPVEFEIKGVESFICRGL